MRRPGVEPDGETVRAALSLRSSGPGVRLACFDSGEPHLRLANVLAAGCADRESNPGYELGKLMSYH